SVAGKIADGERDVAGVPHSRIVRVVSSGKIAGAEIPVRKQIRINTRLSVSRVPITIGIGSSTAAGEIDSAVQSCRGPNVNTRGINLRGEITGHVICIDILPIGGCEGDTVDREVNSSMIRHPVSSTHWIAPAIRIVYPGLARSTEELHRARARLSC